MPHASFQRPEELIVLDKTAFLTGRLRDVFAGTESVRRLSKGRNGSARSVSVPILSGYVSALLAPRGYRSRSVAADRHQSLSHVAPGNFLAGLANTSMGRGMLRV